MDWFLLEQITVPREITESVISASFGLIAAICLISLAGVAERVLLGLAAYNDARSKSNPDAVMWGLLVGFLGLIPGIIYLCIRNTVRNYTICPNCGCSHLASDFNCPRCSAPNPYCGQNLNPLAARQAHQAKVQFTIAMVLVGVIVIASVFAGLSFAATIAYAATSGY